MTRPPYPAANHQNAITCLCSLLSLDDQPLSWCRTIFRGFGFFVSHISTWDCFHYGYPCRPYCTTNLSVYFALSVSLCLTVDRQHADYQPALEAERLELAAREQRAAVEKAQRERYQELREQRIEQHYREVEQENQLRIEREHAYHIEEMKRQELARQKEAERMAQLRKEQEKQQVRDSVKEIRDKYTAEQKDQLLKEQAKTEPLKFRKIEPRRRETLEQNIRRENQIAERAINHGVDYLDICKLATHSC